MTLRVFAQFFQKRGVSEALSIFELFNAVSGLDIPIEAENEAEFVAEVTRAHKWNVFTKFYLIL